MESREWESGKHSRSSARLQGTARARAIVSAVYADEPVIDGEHAVRHRTRIGWERHVAGGPIAMIAAEAVP